MAVSLDIVNALNILPWDKVRTLVYHNVLTYFAIVEAYFRHPRKLEYRDKDGTPVEKSMPCDV